MFVKFLGHKEYGGALLQAMMATLAISSIVALVTDLDSRRRSVLKLEGQKYARDEIASLLASQLVNSEILAASSTTDLPFEGNIALRKCLGYDFRNASEFPTAETPKECDPKKEQEFLLVPIPNHYFGESQDEVNCPNPGNLPENRHISCFLAGAKDNKSVGYSFKRDVGVY